MSPNPRPALLGRVDLPSALRTCSLAELRQLADDLRHELIETVARVGGHFGASLGVVELTLALHRVFDTPRDALIWDIGHQAYVHKILTGRRHRLTSIRRHGGLAPFPSRDESPFDAFGGGHAGVAISAAAGFAAAEQLAPSGRRSIAVIGDGGFTAGMAYEALNHAGRLGLNLLVVFNDNDWSISENVGALRDTVARQLGRAGAAAHDGSLAGLVTALGFRYTGPVDGHDLPALIASLESASNSRGPLFLHVVTVKGRGYAPAEAAPIAFHGVTRFEPETGTLPAPADRPSYSDLFGDWLCSAADQDPRVVAITPAMREGSGLVAFAARHPDRFFDVGIAEQHAVTLAAGMACAGLRPVVAIYSTFLQRALDQLIHDVAIQNLPVLFAIDRGGLVGADGATHHGAFDLSLLRAIPNLLVMAPSDEQECRCALATALAHDGPSAVRYPRGHGPGARIAPAEALPIGRGRVLRRADPAGPHRIAVIGIGAMLATARDVGAELGATVADLRFVKPLDAEVLGELADEHALLVTLEDNAIAGGAGSAISEWLAAHRPGTPVLNLGLPDRFVAHGSREELLADCGLDAAGVLRAIRARLQRVAADDVRARL